MRTEIIGYDNDSIVVRLDDATACMLATVLGRLIDKTEQQSADRLYNLLADEGYSDESFLLDMRVNTEYDPDDEDDRSYFLDLNER